MIDGALPRVPRRRRDAHAAPSQGYDLTDQRLAFRKKCFALIRPITPALNLGRSSARFTQQRLWRGTPVDFPLGVGHAHCCRLASVEPPDRNKFKWAGFGRFIT
jgi:hypothetical protein